MRRLAILCVTALIAVAGPAAAQKEPEPSGALADLQIKLQGDVPAPLVETTFQFVYEIKNAGPDAASGAVFSQYIPGELKIESASSTRGPCTFGDPPGPTTAEPPPPSPSAAPTPEDGAVSDGGGGAGSVSPGYYGDYVTCDLDTMASGANAMVNLELRRVGARESYTNAWVGSNLNDPNYENNYVDLPIPADTSNPADVQVTIDSPTSPDVGSRFTYRLRVRNNGPATSRGTTIFNPIGYGLSFVSATPLRSEDECELIDYSTPEVAAPDYGGYSELYCQLGPLENGNTSTVDVTVERASAYEIWNSASVQSINYDPDYENDYTYSVIAADPSVTSDLRVQMSGPNDTPLVGETFPLSITVGNNGPAAVGDTWFSLYFSPGADIIGLPESCASNFGHWPTADAPEAAPSPEGEPYYPIAPDGVYCTIGGIASGASHELNITLERTSAREVWASGWVSASNHDPNYDNNYRDLVIEPDKSNPADVAVTMTAPTKPDVGSDFQFTLTVGNGGPATAENVVVTDYLPYGVDFKQASSDGPSDTCVFSEDRYDIPPPGSSAPAFFGLREVRCELGSLAMDESATITIDVTRTSEYEIWNSAWATTSNYDDDYENDYASVLVEGEPYPGACPADGTIDGSGGDDALIIGPCEADTAGGADSIEMLPPSAGNSGASTGAGPDTINVNLSTGSDDPRTITVDSGAGADIIRIQVAPGAGNATIRVRAGAGDDVIEVDAPAGSQNLRIVILGGGGNDQVNAASDPASSGLFPGLTARGGPGVDLLHGGPGNDVLSGGRNRDRLYGNLGNDTLRGGAAYDVCRGGPGTNKTFDC